MLVCHFFLSIIDRSLNSSLVFFSKEFIQRSGYDMEANARPLSRGCSSLVRVFFFVRKNGKKREKRERTSNGRHWHHSPLGPLGRLGPFLTDSDRFWQIPTWVRKLIKLRSVPVSWAWSENGRGCEKTGPGQRFRDVYEMFMKCLWNVMSWFVIYHIYIYIYILYISLCIIVYHCVSHIVYLICFFLHVFCMFFYVMQRSFSRCCEGLQEKLQQLLEAKADDLKLQELEKDLISRCDLVRPWCGHGWTRANGW